MQSQWNFPSFNNIMTLHWLVVQMTVTQLKEQHVSQPAYEV